jgi:hypothetical protein
MLICELCHRDMFPEDLPDPHPHTWEDHGKQPLAMGTCSQCGLDAPCKECNEFGQPTY